MKRVAVLTHEFVEYIPDVMEDGVIYVSTEYATVAHKCCCGCGNEVVTPLSPTEWKLTFDGESISLDPSIGNWSFPCHSHYWIKNNRVRWAPRWSQKEINAGRAQESLARDRYFGINKTPATQGTTVDAGQIGEDRPSVSLWRKLKKWLFHEGRRG